MSKKPRKASEATVQSGGFDFLFSLKNVLVCYLVTIVLLFAAALIATYLAMPDMFINVTVSIVTALCLMLCGFRAGRRIGHSGLLNGAVSGIVYCIFLYIIGSLISGNINFDFSVLSMFILALICGALGGLIGVNTKAKKRR